MGASSISDATLDILWSAWTELGARGMERKHKAVAIDPDPLIVFTPALAADDPRLLEQVAVWCQRHGEVVGKTRLWGLERRVPRDVGRAFASFVEQLGGGAAHWGRTKKRAVGPRVTPAAPTTAPPLERPALARLRMRALAGTGARADVLCELLASPDVWVSATDLENLGYTRRSVARVLDELAAAGMLSERPGKAPAAFRLREPRALRTLVSADDLAWPKWTAVLHLAWRLTQLERSAGTAGPLAQVKAQDAWDELRHLSLQSGSREPPVTSGDPNALSNLIRWGAVTLHAGSGGSTAMRG